MAGVRRAVVLGVVWWSAVAFAQEYSILTESTIIGRNYGYPTGTPDPDRKDDPTGRTAVKKLEVVTEVALFAKNLEISGFNNVKGETFIGFLAPVRFRYRAAEEVTIEAGAVVGHRWGDREESLDLTEPLVRVAYEAWEDIYIIGGTIIPTHAIHDALLDDVQRFRESAEQGFQFRADTEHWKQDTWINWRVREDTMRAEEFEVGSLTQFRFWDGVRVDGQMLWGHVGGQLNSANRVENNPVFMGGASYGIPGTRVSESLTWIEDARVGASAFWSRDDTLAARTGTSDKTGTAWEVAANVDTRPSEKVLLRFFGGYFDGDNFSALRGDPLYGLDHYGQIGSTAVFALPGGLHAEAMVVLQKNEDRTNYSFAVNLTWGKGWGIPVGD